MGRVVLILVAAMLAVAVAMPTATAQAAFLPVKQAKRVTRQYAETDYYPARVYVRPCRRVGRTHVNCRISAFYDSGYCTAWYAVRKRARIIVYGPGLEYC